MTAKEREIRVGSYDNPLGAELHLQFSLEIKLRRKGVKRCLTHSKDRQKWFDKRRDVHRTTYSA